MTQPQSPSDQPSSHQPAGGQPASDHPASHQPASDAAAGLDPGRPPSDDLARVRLASPASVLAIVPSLLGFHPSDSLVVLGVSGPRNRVSLTFRYDLPDPADDDLAADIAAHAAEVLGREAIGGAIVIGYGIQIAMAARSQFGRLVAMGIVLNFFFYILINGAMVMGLIPVVGIPMPLVSYGGTAMLTVMFGFGLLMSVHVHRQVEIPRHSGGII